MPVSQLGDLGQSGADFRHHQPAHLGLQPEIHRDHSGRPLFHGFRHILSAVLLVAGNGEKKRPFGHLAGIALHAVKLRRQFPDYFGFRQEFQDFLILNRPRQRGGKKLTHP